jgi:predicted outer membrane protein
VRSTSFDSSYSKSQKKQHQQQQILFPKLIIRKNNPKPAFIKSVDPER